MIPKQCLLVALFFSFVFFFKQKTAYEIHRLTGVQTCALPICRVDAGGSPESPASHVHGADQMKTCVSRRSEERRVGKEGRSRWAPAHLKKKQVFIKQLYIHSIDRIHHNYRALSHISR